MKMRVGHGYDVHRLAENRELVVGGVKIPHETGLLGHSDADVLLHSIMDAILGAMAQGDIGKHFPDSDERYRGISSLLLLSQVYRLMQEKGFCIVNVDCTVIAQRPKLSSYIPQMRQNIATALHCELDAVNVKATTEEGLGFSGREEGIASHAVCLIETAESV